MANKVSWTDQALEDLDAICLFIARDAPRYAEIFADRVFGVTERLENFPLSGRVVPEIGRKDIREIIFESYRVIYRVVSNEVEILTVHHGARRLDSLRLPENA